MTDSDPDKLKLDLMGVLDATLANEGVENPPHDSEEFMGNIIKRVMLAVTPIIEATVEAAVRRAMKDAPKHQAEINDLQDEVVDLSWKIDSNEQYSRRDNIKIVGLEKTQDNENKTNQMVIDVCNKMGVEVTEQDISVSHWLPGKKPSIIVKFVRRDVKHKIMANKKKLGEGDPSFYDDLTVARLRLLKTLRNEGWIKRAFTKDGVIHCIDADGVMTIIKSPHDLVKLGWTDDEIRRTRTLFT